MNGKIATSLVLSSVLTLAALASGWFLIGPRQSPPVVSAATRDLSAADGLQSAAISRPRSPGPSRLGPRHVRNSRALTERSLHRNAGLSPGVAVRSLASVIGETRDAGQRDWDRTAEVLAAQLGLDALPHLAREASDPELSLEERVAAADLFHLVAARDGAGHVLPDVAVEALREGFFDSADGASEALAIAAARPLAIHGDEEDRQALVDTLLSDDSEALRQAAARGLEATDDPAVVGLLAEAVGEGGDDTGVELAVAAIDAMARKASDDGALIEQPEAIVEALGTAIRDEERQGDLRRRAVAALGSLGGPEASGELLDILQAESADADLVRAAGQALARSANEGSVDNPEALWCSIPT